MLRRIFQESLQGLIITLVCIAYAMSFYQVTLASVV